MRYSEQRCPYFCSAYCIVGYECIVDLDLWIWSMGCDYQSTICKTYGIGRLQDKSHKEITRPQLDAVLIRWTDMIRQRCIIIISMTLEDTGDIISYAMMPMQKISMMTSSNGIHRSPVSSPHKGQWRGTLVFSLICVRINSWVNNREAGDMRRHRAHYDVIVMSKG